mmetsp:Transcript_64492/g.199765  ORF Transcript_64492/g.199765 Transcript_64492/m.199765 type:complete len:228 (+) Transcript_64492:218-901(+)
MAEPRPPRQAEHLQGHCSSYDSKAFGWRMAQHADLPECVEGNQGGGPVGQERLGREGGPRHRLPALPAPPEAGWPGGDRRRHLPHELPRRDLWLLRRPRGHVQGRICDAAQPRRGLQRRAGVEPVGGGVERGPLRAEVHGPARRGQRRGLFAAPGQHLRGHRQRGPHGRGLLAAAAVLQPAGARAARLWHAPGVLCVPRGDAVGKSRPRRSHYHDWSPGPWSASAHG